MTRQDTFNKIMKDLPTGMPIIDKVIIKVQELEQQLNNAQKQIVMLRDALQHNLNAPREPDAVDDGFAALAATQDLSGMVLCDAEPVAFTNDTEISYAHYERADKEPTSGAFWKDFSEDSDIPLYKARKQP